MLKLLLKSFRERWLFLLIMCVVVVITLWMYTALFPAFSAQSGEFDKLLSQFPKEMWEIFGMESTDFAISTLEQFFSVEMFSLLWPIMSIILFVSFGIGMIASEIDKGTIEILLSLPVSRARIFLAKYIAGVIMIVVFCLFSVLSIIPLAVAYNIPYQIDVYFKVLAIALLYSIAGFSLTMLLSTLFEKGKASFIASGIYVAMYIINVISTLKDSLDNLKYFTFFHYLDIPSVLRSNKIEPLSIIVFVGVIIVSTVIAVIHFEKRDIST
jgi:ABC-2 type transport system permease protein